MCFNKDDLIREFQLEQDRSNCYFNLMYKTLQFTFLAVASLIVCAFSLYKEQVIINLIFSLIIPICCYVFGIMYAYNAYALTVSGKRAEILHSNIYAKKNIKTKNEKELYCAVTRYVVSDRKITLLSYGVPLGFYLSVPLASYFFSHMFPAYNNVFLKFCPIVCLVIYYILMIIVIIYIFKNHFAINNIQRK